MILYFLRHASAGPHASNPAKDAKRPLDDDGIAQCGLMGKTMSALNVHLDAVISSPLKRAVQTAAAVCNELGFEGKLRLDSSLAPEGTFESFQQMLSEFGEQEAVMVVGHNPNLSEYLGKLVGGRSAARIELKKGAVAKVEFQRRHSYLEWCFTPKLVRAVQASVTTSSRPKMPRK